MIRYYYSVRKAIAVDKNGVRKEETDYERKEKRTATALCSKYWLITRVGKFQGHFHFPLATEKAFPAYSMVICCVTANINGIHFSIINVLMTVGKT